MPWPTRDKPWIAIYHPNYFSPSLVINGYLSYSTMTFSHSVVTSLQPLNMPIIQVGFTVYGSKHPNFNKETCHQIGKILDHTLHGCFFQKISKVASTNLYAKSILMHFKTSKDTHKFKTPQTTHNSNSSIAFT